MITISILNNKGGTGKTASTGAIGAILASKGHDVLLIDSDEQRNLTNNLFTGEIKKTIYDSYRKDIDYLPIEQLNENLYLVPASVKLNSLEAELITSIGRDVILKKLLKKYIDNFDYCIIDCPPVKNILTLNALLASNYVIIPAEAAVNSYRGFIAITELVKEIKENYDTDLEILGAFITRSNPRRTVTRTIRGAISDQIDGILLDSDIRVDVAVLESEIEKKSLIEYAPESNAANDYFQLTEEILKKINNK